MNNTMIKGFFRTHITMDLRRHEDGTFMSDITHEKFNTYRSGFIDGQADLASQAQQTDSKPCFTSSESETIVKLINTIQYMVGIAERGSGKKCSNDQLPERFLLDYVKSLESQAQQPTNDDMIQVSHSKLRELLSSFTGDCYQGRAFEEYSVKELLESIEPMQSQAPEGE